MSVASEKDTLISVLDELPAERVAEVLDFALFLLERSQMEARASLPEERIERLFSAVDRLTALDLPPLTEAEVEAEIQAARAERRAAHARGG